MGASPYGAFPLRGKWPLSKPTRRLILEEWESSEAWWEYVESVGEEWNIHAGITADNKVDWDDTIWVLSDAPQAGRAAP